MVKPKPKNRPALDILEFLVELLPELLLLLLPLAALWMLIQKVFPGE